MATENSPRDGHFILVPLSAIRKLIKSYHTVYQITFLGIYISASKLSISFEDAINNYIRMLYLSPILLGTNACWAAKMEKIFPMQENLKNTDILDESTKGHHVRYQIIRRCTKRIRTMSGLPANCMCRFTRQRPELKHMTLCPSSSVFC